MADEHDPRQQFGVIATSPDAARALRRKLTLLNELATWMAWRHEDEIAAFTAGSVDPEWTAAVMADVIAQKSQMLGRGQTP